MTTHVRAVEARPSTEAPMTLAVLCGGLKSSVRGRELDELTVGLVVGDDRLKVRVMDDLCIQPGVVRGAVQKAEAVRLVLGLCSADYSETEVQAHARRAGLDPLGVQTVYLGGYFATDPADTLAMARAKVTLGAVVARARAFPGSQPENLKAELHSSQQRISRRALFTLPPVSYVAAPTIDRRLCTATEGCTQCVESCPHGAMELDGDEVLVTRSSCQSCGVCVAACPQRAVEFPGWSPQELEAQVASLLETEADLSTRSVVFVCRSSSTEPDTSWLPVSVPCISMVSIGVILGTLAHGATAVGLCPCSEECPNGLSKTVEGRVGYCRQLLGMLGGPSESDRVMFVRSGDTPAPVPSSEPRNTREKRIRLFGRGEVADAVGVLAAQYGVEELKLAHPQSPLGKVEIDEETCTGCGTCATVCPTGALRYEGGDGSIAVTFDASLCSACRQCVSLCPEAANGAIDLTHATDLRSIAQGRCVLFRGDEARCERCGGVVATRPMLARIAAILGDDYKPQFMERLCVSCRGLSE